MPIGAGTWVRADGRKLVVVPTLSRLEARGRVGEVQRAGWIERMRAVRVAVREVGVRGHGRRERRVH